ncbi:MAG: transketolase [Erysipelothrix sp.]|nr:transketolase [Erysipelothrix sp.]
MNIKKLEEHALHIRQNIVEMVYAAGSGHIGGSLSAADIASYLYFEAMNIDESNVDSNKRDRFVLSKGHASPLLYGTLMEKGLLDRALIPQFRQVDSPLEGHPSRGTLAGIDASTGSLGQGISQAVGMALANKIDGNSNTVYSLVGDGESQEGQVWEAAMSAAHFELNNLIVFLDFNQLQIDGDIKQVMNPIPLDEKFKAFGWNVIEIDGHNFEEIDQAVKAAHQSESKPTLILARTIKGKGVSFMENEAGWHGVAPSLEQFEAAMKELV